MAGPNHSSTPAGILFDAYGTLFDVNSLSLLAEELFAGHGAALATLWRTAQIDYSRLRTLSDRYVDFLQITDDALVFACALLRLDLSADKRRLLLEQYGRLHPFPDALPTLQRLRMLGVPLAILSNGTPQMLHNALVAAGMSGLFAHVLSADSVRKFKIAPEVYQLGPTAFGCSAAQLVFVSSNGWDACGAAWFGYRTYWVNRGGHPAERLGVLPSGEGRGLHDLIGFLAIENDIP